MSAWAFNTLHEDGHPSSDDDVELPDVELLARQSKLLPPDLDAELATLSMNATHGSSPDTSNHDTPNSAAAASTVRQSTARPGHGRKNSFASSIDKGGTVVDATDLGAGHVTIRPVRRFGSHRSSADLSATLKTQDDSGSIKSSKSLKDLSTPVSERSEPDVFQTTAFGESALIGRALIDDVVIPTLESVVRDTSGLFDPCMHANSLSCSLMADQT